MSAVTAQPPDVVILDLGLPDIDGLEVCERIRSGSEVPIIVLSARGAEPQKVAALDRGADDYVTKPFGPEELLARVRAALRRTLAGQQPAGGQIASGDITIDFDAQVAWPLYDWMGVAKAGLEAVTRYLARDLGPHGIRVNCVSAGPLRTMAAKGIPGFMLLRAARSPGEA